MKDARSSALLKTIAVTLLFIINAVMIYSLIGIYYLGDCAFEDGISFYDTGRFRSVLNIYVNEIIDAYNDGTLSDNTGWYQNNTAVGFQISSFDQAGHEIDRITVQQEGDQAYEETFNFSVSGLYYESDENETTEGYEVSQPANGVLKIYVYDHLDNDSYFWSQYVRFEQFYSMHDIYLPLLIGGVLASVLLCIYCCFSAGHVRGSEEIHLYWLDKIPFELLLAVLGGTWFLALLVLDNGELFYLMDNYLPLALTGLIGAVLAAIGITFVTLMSAVRRLKVSRFWRSTLVGQICGFLYRLITSIPTVWQTAITMTFIVLMNVTAIGGGNHYGFKLMVIIADVVLAMILVYLVAQCRQLLNAGHKIAAGDTDYRIDQRHLSHMHWVFKQHAEDLNAIAGGVELAVAKQMKSERLKTELITNVSHDIKTPLTSIINYVDLLQKEHTEQQETQYLEILSRNSNRLKKLTEDLVEASKASTGNISATLVPTNTREMIDQAVGEYQEKLEAAELTAITEVDEDAGTVITDGRLLWRVLSNLLSNCVKYALAGTRVYIHAYAMEDDRVCICVKNVSRDALNVSADELMERFVRGDQSRTTEGSGLGLNIARSLTEIMHGSLELTVDGDYFKASVILPKHITA